MRPVRYLKNSIAAFGIAAISAITVSATAANAAGYYADHYAYVISVASWDALNMRKWPAAHSRKVGQIPHHGNGVYVQRCIVKTAASDWCKVHFDGQWGWVNKRFLAAY